MEQLKLHAMRLLALLGLAFFGTLAAAVWPSPLTAWFGSASAKVPVFRPYFHSYDQ